MFINFDMKLWIYFMKVVAKCLHFVTSRMKQNRKLSRVRSTDWKSSLTRVVNHFRQWTAGLIRNWCLSYTRLQTLLTPQTLKSPLVGGTLAFRISPSWKLPTHYHSMTPENRIVQENFVYYSWNYDKRGGESIPLQVVIPQKAIQL